MEGRLDDKVLKHSILLKLADDKFSEGGVFNKQKALSFAPKVCKKPHPAFSDFKNQFCSCGELKSYYLRGDRFKNEFSRFKRNSRRALDKMETKFNLELKELKANAKFFTLNFMQELIDEQGTEKKCIDSTYIKSSVTQGACFYSSMDIVKCFSKKTPIPFSGLVFDGEGKLISPTLLDINPHGNADDAFLNDYSSCEADSVAVRDQGRREHRVRIVSDYENESLQGETTVSRNR